MSIVNNRVSCAMLIDVSADTVREVLERARNRGQGAPKPRPVLRLVSVQPQPSSTGERPRQTDVPPAD